MFAIFESSNGDRRSRGLTFAVVWALTSVVLPLAVIWFIILGGGTWKENVQHGQLYFLSLALLAASVGAELVIPASSATGKIYRALVFVAAVLSVVGYFSATNPVSVTAGDTLIASSVILLSDSSQTASVVMLMVASVFGTTSAFRQVFCSDE